MPGLPHHSHRACYANACQSSPPDKHGLVTVYVCPVAPHFIVETADGSQHAGRRGHARQE